MQNKYKKILTASILSILSLQLVYTALEPTLATAATANDSIIVSLAVNSGVTITTPTDVTMAPNISMSANKSIGSVAWSVSTNSATGYTLAVVQSTATAMMGVSNGDNFANYTETSAGTPNLWTGSTPTSGTKEFGFSAYGTDVPTATWGTSTSGCGVAGVPDVTLKYRGFLSAMTGIQIASASAPTPVGGTASNVCFGAEQVGVYAESGAFTATITATATAV